ncbi:DedA family protein [Acidimangrovimonas sediminis]|uniref:DedA family protein n=1 Tax=Acidimangrovimonas sediminis TaxID=2056283 RepID=UPI0018EA719E|nr:DedA family protein [Acidimangrovimonas sediminis]
MTGSLTAALAGLITAAIGALGYGGVALLMAVESACIPIPSEVIMPFAGYLVSTGRFSLVAVATAGALGCNAGSTLAYLVGARGGRPAVERWGRYVFLSQRELDLAERFFARYGSLAVFLSRLLPLVRTFISLPAGIGRMNFVRFQIYTFLGSWPFCFTLAYAGMKLGQAWDRSPALHRVMHLLDGAVVLALLAGLIWLVARLRARLRFRGRRS